MLLVMARVTAECFCSFAVSQCLPFVIEGECTGRRIEVKPTKVYILSSSAPFSPKKTYEALKNIPTSKKPWKHAPRGADVIDVF